MIEEVKVMDKTMLEQYEEMAVQVCGLDSAKDAATKHTGLCNLLALLYKDLSVALSPRVDDILATAKGGELSFTNYKDVVGEPLVMKVIELITKHAAEVEQWEGEDDTTMAERLRMLDEYKNSDKLDWQAIVEGLSAMGLCKVLDTGTDTPPLDPDRIYYKNGSFRRYWQCRLTYEYKLLRALQPHTDSDGGLETLYKAVMLYVSLMNEQVKVKALIDVLGNTPQNAQNMPNFATTPQCGISTHPEGANAPEMKLKRFLSAVPSENHKKAKSLLQRVMKAGYCNECYFWDASKWKKRKSRLALACFCYLASKRLNLSEKMNAEGEEATNWQPFELLFDYDGKVVGTSQLMNTKKHYMRTNTAFNPPEMDAIENLFNNYPTHL